LIKYWRNGQLLRSRFASAHTLKVPATQLSPAPPQHPASCYLSRQEYYVRPRHPNHIALLLDSESSAQALRDYLLIAIPSHHIPAYLLRIFTHRNKHHGNAARQPLRPLLPHCSVILRRRICTLLGCDHTSPRATPVPAQGPHHLTDSHAALCRHPLRVGRLVPRGRTLWSRRLCYRLHPPRVRLASIACKSPPRQSAARASQTRRCTVPQTHSRDILPRRRIRPQPYLHASAPHLRQTPSSLCLPAWPPISPSLTASPPVVLCRGLSVSVYQHASPSAPPTCTGQPKHAAPTTQRRRPDAAPSTPAALN
jgi:hypothetical protein